MRLNYILPLLTLALLACAPATAQTMSNDGGQTNAPPASAPVAPDVAPVARASELYCAGYIEYAPAPNSLQVVGGEEEQEQHIYAVGDNVFINAGANQGMRVGAEYIVIRPRGQFSSPWSKKGKLGVYTQEIARIRVTSVKPETSVALVAHSCDAILLGDLLRPMPARVSPLAPAHALLDHFAEPSGKQRGRIVLARDGREAPTLNHIVYIDLGSEDNVKEGDRLTIYRPAGTGNITRFRDEEVTPGASYGFESHRFRGGRFANKAPRVKDPTHDGPRGPIETTPEVLRKRPPVPRKIVGEMVLINVQQRTATAIINRVGQEVHTGDYVEVQ